MRTYTIYEGFGGFPNCCKEWNFLTTEPKSKPKPNVGLAIDRALAPQTPQNVERGICVRPPRSQRIEMTTLHAFDGSDGATPNAALAQATDGSFYGTTSRGAAGSGTIFKLIIPPAFQSIAQTNGGFVLTWSAIPRQTCQLQYNINLASTNWLDFGSPIAITNNLLSVVDSTATNSQRFYRVKLLP